MNNKKLSASNSFRLYFFFFYIIMFSVFLTYIIAPVFFSSNNFENIDYEFSDIFIDDMENIEYKIHVDEIKKIKYKEDVYVVSLNDLTIDISESDYIKYIGQNNNYLSGVRYHLRISGSKIRYLIYNVLKVTKTRTIDIYRYSFLKQSNFTDNELYLLNNNFDNLFNLSFCDDDVAVTFNNSNVEVTEDEYYSWVIPPSIFCIIFSACFTLLVCLTMFCFSGKDNYVNFDMFLYRIIIIMLVLNLIMIISYIFYLSLNLSKCV